MPYYHVLIETNEPSEKYYELDKTDLSEIKERIVVPYLKRERFFFAECSLDGSKVKDIFIRKSPFTSGQCILLEWEKSSPELRECIDPEKVVWKDPYTTDITQELLEKCRSLLQEV